MVLIENNKMAGSINSNDPHLTGAIIADAVALPTEAESAKQQEELVLEEAEAQLDKEIDDCVVSMSEDMPEEQPTLAIQDPVTGEDVAICSSQDLVTIKAAPKNGKSTFMSIMVAALLCGQWWRIKSFILHPRILYIDTEMKRRDTQRMGRMALEMAGLPTSVNPEGYYFVNLRKDSPDEILQKLERLIVRFKPDVVFIDGSLDLCNNFNDQEESQRLVKGHYLRLIDLYKCVIITAIHTNKTNDTHASQGHLGAALDKKGEITLECQLDKSSHIVTVSAPTCRHAQVPDFYFRYGKDGMPVACDEEVAVIEAEHRRTREEKQEAAKRAAFEALVSQVTSVMADVDSSGIAQKDLATRLMPILNLKESATQNKIKMLVDTKILLKNGYNGNLILASATNSTE